MLVGILMSQVIDESLDLYLENGYYRYCIKQNPNPKKPSHFVHLGTSDMLT